MDFLIDSGDLLKLEQFAGCRLVRPSKLCLWKPHLAKLEWDRADATYEHKKGWKFRGKPCASWPLTISDFTIELRLQDNGQIGFFPEHLSYLEDINHQLGTAQQGMKMLNLFAYTGLASVFAAKRGMQVTHVEIAKKAIEWAKVNFELNQLPQDAVRIIREDAIEFMRREVRRNNNYDLVIADPPSFSRVDSGKDWKLEETLSEMATLAVKLLNEKGMLVFTNHHFETGGHVLANLLYDAAHGSLEISTNELTLDEKNSPRKIPAGFLVIAKNVA